MPLPGRAEDKLRGNDKENKKKNFMLFMCFMVNFGVAMSGCQNFSENILKYLIRRGK